MRETVLNLKQLLRDVTGFMGPTRVMSTAASDGWKYHRELKENLCTWQIYFPSYIIFRCPTMHPYPIHLLSLTYGTLWKFEKFNIAITFLCISNQDSRFGEKLS